MGVVDRPVEDGVGQRGSAPTRGGLRSEWVAGIVGMRRMKSQGVNRRLNLQRIGV